MATSLLSHPDIHALRGSDGSIVLLLNRSKALNALNEPMIAAFAQVLDLIDADPAAVPALIIASSREKAFCAGGDVRWVQGEDAQGNYAIGDAFFQQEYAVNARLSRCPVPVIALCDGVVMGGGFGISAHGSDLIVTPRTFGAMPECAIGFLPDVGMSHRLTHPRAPRTADTDGAAGADGAAGIGSLPLSRALAVFLGATGWWMYPADLLALGLATGFAEEWPRFTEDMSQEDLDDAITAVRGLRGRLPDADSEHHPSASRVARHAAWIEEVFSGETWQDIDSALEEARATLGVSAEGSGGGEDSSGGEDLADFLRDVDRALAAGNPTSFVATTEVMTTASALGEAEIDAAVEREYEVGARLRRDPNFIEGVRAVLVDKTRDPAFHPASAAEVDPADWR